MTPETITQLQEFDSLPTPQNKEELFERMTLAYDALEAIIAAHDETDLTKPLSESGWSAKDYFAHLWDWENSIVALLLKQDRHEEMGLSKELIQSGDYDAQNAVLYERHQNRPFSDILTDLRTTHQALLDILSDLSYEDLMKPYIHYQPNAEEIAPGDYVNNPAIGWVAGDTYSHYAEHVLFIHDRLQGDSST